MCVVSRATSSLCITSRGRDKARAMNSRAVLPNWRNSSILPFQITNSLTPTPGARYPNWITVSIWEHSRRARPRKSCLTFGLRAAMRDFGDVGELPETKGSFYELLGIPASGSYKDIKRAYKHLAMKYHPDVSPPDRAEECTRLFIEMKEAYDTLSDPGHRAVYDRDLAYDLNLPFATRRHFDEEMGEKSLWKNCCDDQLAGLNKRSTMNNSDKNLSWAACMRRRTAESSAY